MVNISTFWKYNIPVTAFAPFFWECVDTTLLWLVDCVKCLHAIGQTTFQSLPTESMKTIGKQSQNLDILEILGKKEDVYTLFKKGGKRWLLTGG